MTSRRVGAPWAFLAGPMLRLVPAAAILGTLVACITPAARAPGAGPSRPCFEATYAGRFDDGGGPVRFVARVRRCDAAVVVEARGRVAGPSFVAAARAGRARLLLARQRLVVDGPDTPRFWLRHTGVPLSGHWLIEGAPAGRRRFGSWTVKVARVREPGAPPRIIEAVSPDGRSLRLERRRVTRATCGVPWPAIPAGFRHEEEP